MTISVDTVAQAGIVGGAALLAQVGDDVGGVVGEVVKFSSVGGAAVAALVILRRVYRERDEVRSDTITLLRARIAELEKRLEGETE